MYVSTQVSGGPANLVWRNNAFQIPIINVRMGDWNRTPDSSGRRSVETFTTFHRSLPGDVGVAPWRDLAAWHDTSAWFPTKAVTTWYPQRWEKQRTPCLTVTERLLALRARRPLSSWVPFTTYAPTPQVRLLVAVAFSGDVDERGRGFTTIPSRSADCSNGEPRED